MPDQATPAAPGTERVTDQETAIERVAGMLEPDRPSRAADAEAEANREPPHDETTGAETEPEAKSEGKEEEPAAPEGGLEELPATLEGFAEAIGVSADELASHLKATVTVNGQRAEVSLADLRDGYQQGSDYTQKTMKLADERRTFESQRNQASQYLQQRLSEAEEIAVLLAHQASQGDFTTERLAQLADEDPEEYHRVKAKRDVLVERLNGARHRIGEIRTQQTADYRRGQQELLRQVMPEVNDPDKLSSFEREAASYTSGLGFTNQEVAEFFGGPYDYRHILILRDAMKWRAMEKGKPEITKKLKALPKVTKPGALPPRRKSSEEAQAALRDRLRKTRGNRAAGEDAAYNLVKNMLEG